MGTYVRLWYISNCLSPVHTTLFYMYILYFTTYLVILSRSNLLSQFLREFSSCMLYFYSKNTPFLIPIIGRLEPSLRVFPRPDASSNISILLMSSALPHYESSFELFHFFIDVNTLLCSDDRGGLGGRGESTPMITCCPFWKSGTVS